MSSPQSQRGRVRFAWRSALLLLALLAAGCGARERGETVDPAVGEAAASRAVDALLAAELGEAPSPGAAVLVARDGEVLHRAGYGLADLETGEPITPWTSFRLASVSKQFLGMAVMILAERGKLGYDDPVVDHLPELARFSDRLTVRHLLTHTGGLPDYYEALEAEAGGEMPDTRSAMGFLSGWGEPLFSPGERYEYSNPGYEMLALVVEKASGKRFASFMAEEIFGPLGMESTLVRDASEPPIARRAFGYAREGDAFVRDDDHPLNHIIGSGGIYSSVEDLLLWDQALYGERLVRSESLAQAFTPAKLSSGREIPYGFGWRLGRYGGLGRRVVHAGGWVGFSTFIARYPERRFTVIVLSNLGDFDAEAIAERITDIYYPSQLVAGAAMIDGSGRARAPADVRIEAGRIAAIGDLEPRPGEPVIDAAGRVLAPGFIDAHSHADADLEEHPEALAAVSQGITTVVTGQDGESRHPLAQFFGHLEESPPAVNVASYSGHGTLREEVLGEDFRRAATAEETGRMAELLAGDLEAGALGLSTGLEYDPGIYSRREEVLALARVAASRGGRYISHLRSEDRRFWEAVDEILTLGREAGLPVQISHLKLALRGLHGQADRLLGRLDEARAAGVTVTADIYPYTFWQSTLTVMFPDRDYQSREAAAFAVEELAVPEEMLIPVFEPEPALAGLTLAEIAERRGSDPVTTLIELIRQAEEMRAERGEDQENDVESVIAVSMREEDIDRLMAWPHTVICTDGELAGSHPRGFGSFPRVLARQVRERGVLTLEEAVRKMSGLTAESFGIAERGRIEVGLPADLVLFDPETITDRATTEEPHAPATGVETVWVNGEIVYERGLPSGRRPGRVLRRERAPAEGGER